MVFQKKKQYTLSSDGKRQVDGGLGTAINSAKRRGREEDLK